jgi:F0F1-type ATP synthase assembly protein I
MLALAAQAVANRLRNISQASKFDPQMADTEGTPRKRSAEDEQNIANQRDALLARARDANSIGISGGKPDPRLMGLGLQFVVAILLALYAGMWVDAKLHTAPWFMLIGALLGASAGFYSMFRVLMSEDKRMDEENKKR